MKYPILASFIVFGFYLTFILKRSKKKEKNMKEDFWERERLANTVRRKSLDGLNYVEIPFDLLPMEMLAEHPGVREFHEKLRELSGKKIVNFTGYSNTDLKLAYGAPNINLLSEYDQNFTELITLLQSWAGFLLQEYIPTQTDAAVKETAEETAQADPLPSKQSPSYPIPPLNERKEAAKVILEYAVSVGSDIYVSYEILTGLYKESEEPEKISALKDKAEELRSLSKTRILHLLEQADAVRS